MSDAALFAAWSALVAAALVGGALLARRGVPPPLLRDALHIGAGVWVFGWPAWDGRVLPVLLPWAALALLAALPLLTASLPALDRVVRSVTTRQESWSGLVLYALAFALLTTVAFVAPPAGDAAAAGLLALAWGDGVGGLVGRRWGRRGYRLPWGKRKSWIGSATVAAGAALGVVAWAGWSGAEASPALLLGSGLLAAAAEALSPAGSDNLAVPALVFAWVRGLG